MAGSMQYGVCLKNELCVRWTTELPYEDTPCASPNICITKDSGYLLRLCFSGGSYCLRLCYKVYKVLEKPITVTTYLLDWTDKKKRLLTEIRTVSEAGDWLWIQTENVLRNNIRHFPNARKIDIVCVFHNCLESDMENISAAQAHVSTQTDSVYEGLQHLSCDISSLMKDETFSDVKLKCGICTFSAHKSVLASRSEVFSAMFRNKKAESETGVVEVQDLDPVVLEQLLNYMYSGEKPNCWQDTGRSLYEGADKYAVYDLKKACSECMVARLTPENCLEMLVLADRHTDEAFKEAVSFFVAGNLTSLKREGWSVFKTNHSELAVAVLEKRCADALSFQT